MSNKNTLISKTYKMITNNEHKNILHGHCEYHAREEKRHREEREEIFFRK